MRSPGSLRKTGRRFIWSFSAHGTPMKLVRDGDPYRQQIVRTYNAVLSKGEFGLAHHLCYQSKVGPQKVAGTISGTDG